MADMHQRSNAINTKNPFCSLGRHPLFHYLYTINILCFIIYIIVKLNIDFIYIIYSITMEYALDFIYLHKYLHFE